MFEHPAGHVASDRHQRGIRSAGLCHLGDRLVPEVVEAQAADRGGGSFPGCNGGSDALLLLERLLRGLSADAPGGFAYQLSPPRAPALLRA